MIPICTDYLIYGKVGSADVDYVCRHSINNPSKIFGFLSLFH
jgi:hypothetical protein